jgi:hypothetical protein
LNSDSDFAWVLKEIEGEDWFKEAGAVTNKESQEPDWFDEVDKGEVREEESDDAGSAVVNVFNRDAAPGGVFISSR